MSRLCVIRIAGAKNAGKTTLIESLIAEFISFGIRVGTLKHTSHTHVFDKPRSDSHRHSEAGSAASVIVSPDRIVLHAPRPAEERLVNLLEEVYDGCDIILCEGHTNPGLTTKPAPLVECIAPGNAPLYGDDPDLVAFAADNASVNESVGARTFDRSDAGGLARWLRERLKIRTTT